MGRPIEFTPETADELCERIALGESLKTICADEHMPGERTVHRWLSMDDDAAEWVKTFRQQYAHAREVQADTFADKIVDEAFSATDAAIGRLRMDALKWKASKLAPKKYGDKTTHEHTGEGGGAIKSAVTVEFVRPAS
jgi:hypothetical protein